MKRNGLSLDGQLWWLERNSSSVSVTCTDGVWTVTAETNEHGTVTATSTNMYKASTEVFEAILPEAEKETSKNGIRDLFSAILPSLVDGSLQETADDALEDEWTDEEAES